jgi:hypothetical protein
MMPLRNASVDRLVLNAAALVRAACPGDWPGGFVVVPERLPPRIHGMSCGTGAEVAELYRLRPGVRAVLVDVWKLATDPADATPVEVVRVERLALHEAAHAMVATPKGYKPDAVDGALSGAGEAVPAYPAEAVAAQHGPRWAMAFWLMGHRAAAYRPYTGEILRRTVAAEVEVYGYPPADLEQLARGVEPDTPLAARLVKGGVWDALLCSRLPDEQTRAVAIVAAGVPCEGTSNGGNDGCHR